MNSQVTLRVADIIGTPLCISSEDGQKVFDILKPLIEEGKVVTVSFERVTTIISLFLNAAIGQLYGNFNESQVRNQLQVKGLANDDLEMLKRVVDNAKSYYSNRKGYDEAWSVDGEDEE